MADRDDYKIETILITGGAGFIGSNFISYIMGVHPDYRVVCVDKLTYAGSMDNLNAVADRENFQFYKADICDRENIFKIFESEKPDIVVNFAAESGLQYHWLCRTAESR